MANSFSDKIPYCRLWSGGYLVGALWLIIMLWYVYLEPWLIWLWVAFNCIISIYFTYWVLKLGDRHSTGADRVKYFVRLILFSGSIIIYIFGGLFLIKCR